MSEQQQQLEQAYNDLFENFHAPVFFDKLARDYGVQPQSQQEALDLLTLGGTLMNAYHQHGEKQASTSRFSPFLDELHGTVASQQQQSQARVKEAAARLAQDPGVVSRLVLLKAAEAQQQATN